MFFVAPTYFQRLLPGCVYLLCLLVGIRVNAQEKWVQTWTAAAPSPVTCTPDESFVCQAEISNPGPDTLRYRVAPFESPYFLLLKEKGSWRTIAPGQVQRLSLRFLNRLGKINGAYQLPVKLEDEKGRTVPVAFQVNLKGGMEAKVFAEVLQEKILVLPQMLQINVPVKMRSFLPAGTSVLLELATPHPALQLQQPVMQVLLPQMRDTVIVVPLVKIAGRDMRPQTDQPIVLSVKAGGGRLMTTVSVLPQMVSTSRSLFVPEGPPSGLQMRMDAALMQGNDLQNTVGAAYTPAGPAEPLAWQFNYTQFRQSGFRQLYATYLAYRKEHVQVQLGSVNDFHELNLQGRGLTAAASLPGQKWKANVWVVDNNVDLLRSFADGATDRVVSSQLAYGGIKGGDVVVNSSWFQRGSSYSQGMLHFAEWVPAQQGGNFIALRVGGSRENFRLMDTALAGLSARVEGRLQQKRISWYGRFTYASPTYAGNQRGLSNATVQASLLKTQHHSLGFRFNLYSIQIPASLARIVGPQNMFAQSVEAESMIQWKQNSVQVRPYYLHQKQQFPILLSGITLESHALNTSIQFSRRLGKVGVGLHWDGGWQLVTQKERQNNSLSWRGGGNLTLGHFNTGVFLQQGSYFLSEQQVANVTGRKFQGLTINSGYEHAFGKYWRVQTTGSMVYNSNIDYWQYNAMQLVQWAKNGWQAHASCILFGGQSKVLQVRAGVQRSQALHPQGRGLVSAEIRVFEDRNSNGIRDAGEPLAPGQLVQFDKVLMMANAEGLLRVTKVKAGIHQVRVLANDNAGKVLVHKQVQISGKTELLMGIAPMFTITGKVVSRTDRFTGAVESVGNIRIILSGPDGEQTTFTRANGTFDLQVQPGTYRVLIAQLRNKKAPDAEAVVVVDPQTGFSSPLELVWTAGERPVQIKKVKIQ